MKLYNTLTRSVEEFKPINPPNVGMYSCGPTVYDYQHIGHMRRYVGDAILLRVLKQNGYNVKHVMNITDVGHLVSDADEGEDKMEKGAKKFGKSVWDIAKMFEEQFAESCEALHIELPKDLMHATDFIKEQIALIQVLEGKGYTYRIDDGIYFDTSKFANYFQLSHQKPEELKAGARVEMVKGKNSVSDFALWKFSPSGEKRQMEWESPWGIGFPGWHIECSAMSMKALGETFDIHTGGIDHIMIHHTNEIAQAEAATGKKFVNYWVHHNFLLVDGKKMSKSLGNFYTVQDVIKNGFDPISLRYLYLQTHYRQEMNFTWESLEAAQNALQRLRNDVNSWGNPEGGAKDYEKKFSGAVNNDLNTSEALSVVWELAKADVSDSAKAASVLKMDSVLGLGLGQMKNEEIPEEVQKLVAEREALRAEKKFHLADQLRDKVKKLGYEIFDEAGKTKVRKS